MSKMKKFFGLATVLILVLSLLPISALADARFAASRNSEVFHYSWCDYVDRIYDENLITFDTVAEAVNSGRRGCYVCKPTRSVDGSSEYLLARDEYDIWEGGYADGKKVGYEEGYKGGYQAGYQEASETAYQEGYQAASEELSAEYEERIQKERSRVELYESYLAVGGCLLIVVFLGCIGVVCSRKAALIKSKNESPPKDRSGAVRCLLITVVIWVVARLVPALIGAISSDRGLIQAALFAAMLPIGWWAATSISKGRNAWCIKVNLRIFAVIEVFGLLGLFSDLMRYINGGGEYANENYLWSLCSLLVFSCLYVAICILLDRATASNMDGKG